MARSKTDWVAVEHKFVTGLDDVTLPSLAKECHVALQTLHNRSSKGDWGGKRVAYREAVSRLAEQKAVEQVSDHMASVNRAFSDGYEHVGLGLLQIMDEVVNAHGYGGAVDAGSMSRLLNSEAAVRLKNMMLTSAIAFDKWRLATGQATTKAETQLQGDPDKPLSMDVTKQVNLDGLSPTEVSALLISLSVGFARGVDERTGGGSGSTDGTGGAVG